MQYTFPERANSPERPPRRLGTVQRLPSCVQQSRGHRRLRKFSCLDYFLYRAFAQLTYRADDDLRYLVDRLRRAWPVVLCVRGDAGSGMPWMYAVCEELGVEYLFGLAANKRLQKASDALVAEAVRRFDETKTPQRLFDAFWYQAGTWEHARWVIVKAEANSQGTNHRFVVTNRPGAQVVPGAAYDDYAERGESESRNKKLKCGLQNDRTSDHRFMANFFRLYLHAAAFNMLARLRQAMALPPEPVPAPDVPPQALNDAERRRHYQRCRQRDRLAQAQPCTWRTLLFKGAAEIIVSTRRVVVRLSAHWPNLNTFQRVCQSLAANTHHFLASCQLEILMG